MDPYGPPPDYLPRPPLDPLTKAGIELAACLAWPEQLGARVRYIVGGWAAHVAANAAGVPGADSEVAAQLPLLHDIFGNPFRPVAVDPAWLTADVVAIARGMYEARDFSAMPVLADALQYAGWLPGLRGLADASRVASSRDDRDGVGPGVLRGRS